VGLLGKEVGRILESRRFVGGFGEGNLEGHARY